MTMSAGLLPAFVSQWTSEDVPKVVSALRGGRLVESTVTCFEHRLPSLRALDMSLGGGGNVRMVVDAELRLATDLLASSSYNEQLGRRLIAVAAELGRVAGWASFDAGYHAAAERYWTAALRAAHSASDRLLGANILKCMSLQRVDLKRPTEAVALAEAAHLDARNAPPRIAAMLTVRLARTYATVGDRASAERMLVAAEAAMTNADTQETPGWASYFDVAEYCAQVAATCRQLRQHDSVERWLARTIAMQPDARSRDRATYFIWRADNALGLGEVERSCHLLAQAVPDLASSRSARNARRLRQVVDKLDKYITVGAVRDLRAQMQQVEVAV